MKKTLFNKLVALLGFFVGVQICQAEGIYISEFMAANNVAFTNQSGQVWDWVEICNGTAETINLKGWGLSDNPKKEMKWTFPSLELKSGEYLIVYASGREELTTDEELHCDFKLSRESGSLLLSNPVGMVVSSYFDYPEQFTDISYGIDQNGIVRHFLIPTPNAANVVSADKNGPIIESVSYSPKLPTQPAVNEPIKLQVKVTQTGSPVHSVKATWKKNFEKSYTISLLDDGAHDDGDAGDGIYGGEIPCDDFTPGCMIRWYIQAKDDNGVTTRFPFYDSSCSTKEINNAEQYFGTVIQFDPLATKLETLNVFVNNEGMMMNQDGTFCSIFYNGEFYDNVWICGVGSSTLIFPKRSMKLGFPKNHGLTLYEGSERYSDLRLVSNWGDIAKVRNVASYDYFTYTGGVSPISYPTRIQCNGEFYGIFDIVEDYDSELLTRVGLDKDGALYKIKDPLKDVSTAGKKTRNWEDFSDLQTLIDSTDLTKDPADRESYIYDHVNLPQMVNYFAGSFIVYHEDQGQKNFYLYYDNDGSEEWFILPYDLDLTWGRTAHNGNYLNPKIYTDLWIDAFLNANGLYGSFFRNLDFQTMLYCRLDTLMKRDLFTVDENGNNSYIVQKMLDIQNSMMADGVPFNETDLYLDEQKWPRTSLYNYQTELQRIIGEYKEGDSQMPYIVGRREVLEKKLNKVYTPSDPSDIFNVEVCDFVSAEMIGSLRESYICLTNKGKTAIDLSGWKLSGSAEFTFAAGTVALPEKAFYVARNLKGFRNRSEFPNGGNHLFVVGPYAGNKNGGNAVYLYDEEGTLISSYASPLVTNCYSNLRIVELMYAPIVRGTDFSTDDDDYAWLEIKNCGEQQVNLKDVSISEGIDYTFSNYVLEPGKSVVLVKNREHFASRYPTDGLVIFDGYSGNLAKGGESLSLYSPGGFRIQRISYSSDWFSNTCGKGYSLVCVNPKLESSDFLTITSWKSSSIIGGTPGFDERWGLKKWFLSLASLNMFYGESEKVPDWTIRDSEGFSHKSETTGTPLIYFLDSERKEVGSYPVYLQMGDLQARKDVVFEIIPGVVNVKPCPIKVVADDLTMEYSTDPFVLTWHLEGLPEGGEKPQIVGRVKLSVDMPEKADAGQYPIIVDCSEAYAENYTLSGVNAVLTVLKNTSYTGEIVRVYANNKLYLYGKGEMPDLTYQAFDEMGKDVTAQIEGEPFLFVQVGEEFDNVIYPIEIYEGWLDDKEGYYNFVLYPGKLLVTTDENAKPIPDDPVLPIKPQASEMRPVITEFMAANVSTLQDSDGDYSDWIEICNVGDKRADLEGWGLSDNASQPFKWVFPKISLQPGEFLIVFASEKDRKDPNEELHTNFKLSSTGEPVLLTQPDGKIVSQYQAVTQYRDVSYGLYNNSIQWMDTPTPGSANVAGYSEVSPGVEFSLPDSVIWESTTLELSCPDPNAKIYYTLDGKIPTRSSSLYTAPIEIMQTLIVKAIAEVEGKLYSPVTSGVYMAVSPSVKEANSDLPIAIIDNLRQGELPLTTSHYACVAVYEPGDGRTTLDRQPDLLSTAIVHRRGSTTVSNQKYSFTMEYNDEYWEDKDMKLMGMPAESDWVFYAPNTYDNIMIHNQFMYELSNEIGLYAPRTQGCEIYLNRQNLQVTADDYFGVYVAMEKIKISPDRVNIEEVESTATAEPDVTGGYLLKIDRSDSGELLFEAANQSICYVSPKGKEMTNEIRAPQVKYLKNYFNEFYNALKGNVEGAHYSDYLDVDAAIDHNLLNTLAFNIDALRLSTYFSKPKNGKITYGPIWDFDRALGSGDGHDANPEIWNHERRTDYFHYIWWDDLFRDIDFFQKYIDRYEQLRTNYFSMENLSGLISRFTGELTEAEARDFARWGESVTGRHNGYPRTATHMRQWLQRRVNFMDSQFVPAPTISAEKIDSRNTTSVAIKNTKNAPIYYTMDGSDPRLPGGAISPTAKLVEGEINLNGVYKIVARTYDITHTPLCGETNAPSLVSYWSGPVAYVTGNREFPLVITEFMYSPVISDKDVSQNRDDYAWVELTNIGGWELDLKDVRLAEGISFIFPSFVLKAGESVVVAKNPEVFATRYDTTNMNLFGPYSGNLARKGETLLLFSSKGEELQKLTYSRWYSKTDRQGYSLAIVDAFADNNTMSLASNWTPSEEIYGTPGIWKNVIVEELRLESPKVEDGVLSFFVTTQSSFVVEKSVDLKNWEILDAEISGNKVSIKADKFYEFYRVRIEK